MPAPPGVSERDFSRALEELANASSRDWLCTLDHDLNPYRDGYPTFLDRVADMYSFNDHAVRRFHEKLQDVVDPNNTLSPGKFGIWQCSLGSG